MRRRLAGLCSWLGTRAAKLFPLVRLPHGASFKTAAPTLAAAARTAVTSAITDHADSGGRGATCAGPAVQRRRDHGAAEPRQGPRLRTKVAAVRGCVELVIWLQFDGEELGQDAIAAAVAGAEAEVARSSAAAAGLPDAPGAPASEQGQGGGVLVAPALWSASRPLDSPGPSLQASPAPSSEAPDGAGEITSSDTNMPYPFVAPPSGGAGAAAARDAVVPAGPLAGAEIELRAPGLRISTERRLPAPLQAVQLLVALDPPVITAGTGSGGSGGALQVFLCMDEGLALPDGVEVRLVVEQRGAVVAEVARVHIGPQGGSTSLDVSGLAEGSAALLVLPVWEEGSRMRPTTAPGLLYVPLAVVPAPVAEELRGLFDDKEQAAAGKWPSAGPQARRAFAYMHHFSPLLADMAPLLPGEAEGEQLGQVSGSGAGPLAAGPARDVARAAAGFLADRGMAATLRYLAAGLRSAGLDEVLGALAARGSSGGVSSARWGSAAASLLSDGDISAADAGPAVGDGTVPDPAAVEAAAETVAHVEGGQAAAEERRRKQRATRVAAAGLACMARERLALAAAAVFMGFRDAGTERRCTRFRDRGARAYDTAPAAVNALLVLATLAAVAAWRSGAAVLGAAGSLPPGWAVVQLGLCVCALVLPAVLFKVAKSLAQQRTREPLVWVCHAVSMVLLCRHVLAWGGGAAGGPVATAAPLAAPSGRALAAVCAALQPASYGLHVKLYGPLFALDAALLTLLYAAADGGAWLSGLAPAAGVVAASLLASTLVDLFWRLRFLQHVSREAESLRRSDRSAG
ncbi:hypothetical protein HYH03_016541 [Edaphochlamys debaryana]|uniref:Uncharacterized protein n=1 Tax=Edaphochlamys debaryana TaxID=47281 RepID=A0A835XIJ1_9CHLO|nr:hypothetical protein HYH03_016541 [Edaphochlamys debaryana]|eukprot:KAG2484713.1 hypothetical protein HYH03_016541 [Edaphochlamys debaryana]